MKLTCVLTAVNANPKYTRFIPLFIKQWNRLYPDLTIRIVYVGPHIPRELERYSEYLILFPEIPGVSSVYVAQTIRLLYPSLMGSNDTTLITDMDMLPGNSVYFTEMLRNVPDDAFVNLPPRSAVGKGEFAMCYNAASTATWRRIFGINTADDIRTFLRANYNTQTDGVHGGIGWCQDQELLYTRTVNDRAFVKLGVSMHKRLDFIHHRYDLNTFRSMIESGQYSDCHLYAELCPWTTAQMSLL